MMSMSSSYSSWMPLGGMSYSSVSSLPLCIDSITCPCPLVLLVKVPDSVGSWVPSGLHNNYYYRCCNNENIKEACTPLFSFSDPPTCNTPHPASSSLSPSLDPIGDCICSSIQMKRNSSSTLLLLSSSMSSMSSMSSISSSKISDDDHRQSQQQQLDGDDDEDAFFFPLSSSLVDMTLFDAMYAMCVMDAIESNPKPRPFHYLIGNQEGGGGDDDTVVTTTMTKMITTMTIEQVGVVGVECRDEENVASTSDDAGSDVAAGASPLSLFSDPHAVPTTHAVSSVMLWEERRKWRREQHHYVEIEEKQSSSSSSITRQLEEADEEEKKENKDNNRESSSPSSCSSSRMEQRQLCAMTKSKLCHQYYHHHHRHSLYDISNNDDDYDDRDYHCYHYYHNRSASLKRPRDTQ